MTLKQEDLYALDTKWKWRAFNGATYHAINAYSHSGSGREADVPCIGGESPNVVAAVTVL